MRARRSVRLVQSDGRLVVDVQRRSRQGRGQRLGDRRRVGLVAAAADHERRAVTPSSTLRSGRAVWLGQVRQGRRRVRPSAARRAARACSARPRAGHAGRLESRRRAAWPRPARRWPRPPPTARGREPSLSAPAARPVRPAGRTRPARTGRASGPAAGTAPPRRGSRRAPGSRRTRRRRREDRRRGPRRSTGARRRIGAAVPAELEEDLAAGHPAAQRSGVGNAAGEPVREHGRRFAGPGHEVFEARPVRHHADLGRGEAEQRPTRFVPATRSRPSLRLSVRRRRPAEASHQGPVPSVASRRAGRTSSR